MGGSVFNGYASDINLALDSSDTVYAAYGADYEDDGISDYKANVKKYNGTSWESVGSPDFSDCVYGLCLALDSNDVPYIAYSGWGITVKKFDGTEWITVGRERFTDGDVTDLSLAFDSEDTPYIAYGDFAKNDSKMTVRKYSR